MPHKDSIYSQTTTVIPRVRPHTILIIQRKLASLVLHTVMSAPMQHHVLPVQVPTICHKAYALLVPQTVMHDPVKLSVQLAQPAIISL
jgi:hypothetical protein